MRLVERMVQHPPTCLHCGRGNTDEAEFPLPNLDLEREVNWGDSTYIWVSCRRSGWRRRSVRWRGTSPLTSSRSSRRLSRLSVVRSTI